MFPAQTTAFIQSLPASDRTIDDVTASLDKEIKKVQGESRTGRKKRRKTIISRGNVIRNKPSDVNAYTLSLRDSSFNAFAEKKQPSSMYMSLGTGRKNAYVTDANISVTSGGRTVQSNEVEVISNTDDQLHLQLFPGKGVDLANNDTFELKGNIQLDDGTHLSLNTKGSTENQYTKGQAKPIIANPVPAPVPAPPVSLYGVNNIGVGVLRKVEQEVCCYVPGEVSRIENVMAREYKERHTRNLVVPKPPKRQPPKPKWKT